MEKSTVCPIDSGQNEVFLSLIRCSISIHVKNFQNILFS
jgi:hypothetical protein